MEWTEEGHQLVASKAYRGISPVLDHRRSDNVVFALRRASLVNRPNLRGLQSLHQESEMDFLSQLIASGGTSEVAVLAAVTTLHAEHASRTVTLHAVAKAAGLEETADGKAVTETVTRLITEADQTWTRCTTPQAQLGEATYLCRRL